MKVSNHANRRSQQRAIPKDYIELILEYGTPVRRQGDTLEYRLHKKDRDRLVKHLKHLINSIDRCTNKAVLVDSDMKQIVTVYNLM
jgi:transposase